MSILLTTEWTKHPLARAVPGAYYDPDHKGWVLNEPTPRGAAVALKLFPELNLTAPELVKLRGELLDDVRPVDNAGPFYEAGGRIAAPRVRDVISRLPVVDPHTREVIGTGWQLKDYQEVDLAYGAAVLRQHRAFYLGWERGLGKTLGTCCLIDDLECESTLIVAPNTAKSSVWAAELERLCPWLHVIVLGNSARHRELALRAAQDAHAAGREFALVVHYEAMALVAGKGKKKSDSHKAKVPLEDGWERLGIPWDLLVTDEDHRLANMQSQMARAYMKIPSSARLMLSGSIIQNHLEELYSPHRRAFRERYSSKWRDWNDRFLDYVEGYGKILVGVRPERADALRQELGVWMVHRTKAVLGMTEPTYEEERIELSPKQRKVYNDLRDACMAELENGEVITADAGIAMLGKLRQVATGLDLVGHGIADSSKLDRAVDIIMDGEDDEFVVFSWYKAAVTALQDRLAAKGIEAFCVTGDTPHATRAEMIARFQNGEGKVFIGTISTLGESVNLQRANTVIRLDRSWNPMDNAQAEDRVHRQGQRRPVTIIDLVAPDTVDELNVQPALANKAALRAAVLGA